MSAAAILAGGRATRMGGRAKSFLVVDGERIIDRQLAVVRTRCSEILIVTNDPPAYAEFGLPMVTDASVGFPAGEGPLVGILAALTAATAEHVLVVACDMPYLSGEAVDLVADPTFSEDVVIPVVQGREEPLFARYARTCIAPIRARLSAGERKVTCFLPDVTVRRLSEETLRGIDPALRFLENRNRP